MVFVSVLISDFSYPLESLPASQVGFVVEPLVYFVQLAFFYEFTILVYLPHD